MWRCFFVFLCLILQVLNEVLWQPMFARFCLFVFVFCFLSLKASDSCFLKPTNDIITTAFVSDGEWIAGNCFRTRSGVNKTVPRTTLLSKTQRWSSWIRCIHMSLEATRNVRKFSSQDVTLLPATAAVAGVCCKMLGRPRDRSRKLPQT